MPRKKVTQNKAWIVAVDMGYGHQRTAHPLKFLAEGGQVINANNYRGIPDKDRTFWQSTRTFYEFISRFKRVPLVGSLVFRSFDQFQKIMNFYPRRDQSRPNFTLKRTYGFIKRGWGKHLIEQLKKTDPKRPFISTFYTPAFMAEVWGYEGDIFCVVADADVARSWAPSEPEKSRIIYCAPNTWVADRLQQYGVKKSNIVLTGYPLPLENVGTQKLEIVRKDTSHRLVNLDPEKAHYEHYQPLVAAHIGSLPQKANHPLTILFSIGGAGAQTHLVGTMIRSLADSIKKGKVRVILAAGIRPAVYEYFVGLVKECGLEKKQGKGVVILFSRTIQSYFDAFNKHLHTTDILWTKPSELSFYTGLGVPLIIAPSIGAQEDFNLKWLRRIAAGIVQENPYYIHQWLFDYLKSGRFAEAALHGFIEAEQLGAANIAKTAFKRRKKTK